MSADHSTEDATCVAPTTTLTPEWRADRPPFRTTAWFAIRDRVLGARWTISAPTSSDCPRPARVNPMNSAEAPGPTKSARGTLFVRRDPQIHVDPLDRGARV